MNRPVISLSSLTKQYRVYKKAPGFWGALQGLYHREYEIAEAVSHLSFSIEEGEFVGFLGSNGAGKTTTLKMLSGLLYPTSGTAEVLGFVPWDRKNEYRRQFALLMGQKNQLWWDLPAWESLELNSRIYGIDSAVFRKTAIQLSEMLLVQDKLNVMVRELSLGERMKLELIAALLHRPRVLYLDEPTIGLDVVSQRIVREFLKEYNRSENTTILLTSHYMSDIERLCSRVIIIDEGKLFFDGALQSLTERYADFRIIRFETDGGEVPASEFPWVTSLERQRNNVYEARVPRKYAIEVCRRLLAKLPIVDFSIQEVSTEEVVRNIFNRSREEAIRNPSISFPQADPAVCASAA